MPNYVLTAWRARYIVGEDMDLQAHSVLNEKAAVVRSEGTEPNARTVWLRLADRIVKQGGAPPELLAATALAGLATGLRPQGFEKPV